MARYSEVISGLKVSAEMPGFSVPGFSLLNWVPSYSAQGLESKAACMLNRDT